MKLRSAFLVIPLVFAALFTGLLRFFAFFPLMPVAATQEAGSIDKAFQACLILTIAIFALTLSVLFYSLVRFRATKQGEEGEAIHHSKGWWFESLWITVSLGLTIGLAIFGWRELRTIYGSPASDLDIEVRAEQYSWEFFYPKYNQLASRLYLPLGKRVRLLITSKDVVHSFWVPEFRMKQDAVPGRLTTLLFTPSREGSYLVLCNQLCGRDHTIMTAFADVVSEATLIQKLTGQDEAW